MSGWGEILAPGERVLWQDRPQQGLRLTVRDPMEFGLGLSLAFGPVTPMLLLWLGGNPLWLAFLPALLLGGWFLGGWCLWDAYRRARTWYSLTDRRAFVATALLGRRRLRTRELDAPPRHDRRTPGTLDFGAHGDAPFRFERIADAWAVRDLVLAARGPAARTAAD